MTLGDSNNTLQYVWCIEREVEINKTLPWNLVSQYKDLYQWNQAPFHLYDLVNDPHEKDDLVKKFSEVVSKMD